MDVRAAIRGLVDARLSEAKPEPPSHIKAARDQLDSEHREAGKALKAIPGVGGGPAGVTPDHIKASPEYKAAKQKHDAAFQALRSFNSQHANKYDWRKYK